MWSLLARRWQVTAVAVANLLVLVGLHAAWAFLHDGQQPSPLQWFMLSVTIVAVVLAGIADSAWRFIWRIFPAIQPKAFPDLNGVWKGQLKSTWINPETNQEVPPIDATITIRQRLFTTHVSLQTGESQSHSTRVWLERFPETRRFRIWYSYDNEPRAMLQHRSPEHEGVAFLELSFDADQDRLTGGYYTGRRTMGDVDVRRITRRRLDVPRRAKRMRVQ